MRVGILSVFVDYHRRGRHNRGALQPQAGALIAALLPERVEVEVINDVWEDPDWSRSYDLLIVSAMHSDFDRARQVAHYWRRRGAKTVIGGTFASLYPELCAPWFDCVVVGDPEDTIPRLYADFEAGRLGARYVSAGYFAEEVRTPRFDLVADCQLVPLGLEATRGCPFACQFCILTGRGTRFETRPVSAVLRDLRTGMDSLRRHTPPWRRNVAVFYDNNLAGSFAWLRELCAGLAPLGLRWGCSVTFNAASNRELVKTMAKAGCGFIYVGLESFNDLTLAAMNKRQNIVRRTREMIAMAHDHGVLVTAGLMVSPWNDDLAYLRAIPEHLGDCGLHVPTYVCFETPFPGTPLFDAAAAAPEPAFLPGALLRDFSTYTLVLRPRYADTEAFVQAYRDLLASVYAPARRLGKVLRDAAALLPRGGWRPLIADIVDQWTASQRPDADRTYIAGTDRAPPEDAAIPFSDADFTDERERERILAPIPVSDDAGRLLPAWRARARLGN